jgi:thiosulfate/3-mercaptopyruvate sulfurtransferase
MHTTIIDIRILDRHLHDPAWVVVDSRFDLHDVNAGYKAYLDAHIPGAVYADLNRDLSDPPVPGSGRHPLPEPGRLIDVFSTLGISADRQVLVYDASFGSIAARLWWLLRYMGHTGVCVLDGGWQAWTGDNLPVEKGANRNPQRRFHGRPRPEYLVGSGGMMSASMLVDAREPARYRGEQEPLDPVAGHIPGAVNHHWMGNLDTDGRFLTSHQLRRNFQKLYAGTPSEQVVCYCGSGVTACHNILATVHAGMPEPKLYAGSWSEWCADAGRPVAAGPG